MEAENVFIWYRNLEWTLNVILFFYDLHLNTLFYLISILKVYFPIVHI